MTAYTRDGAWKTSEKLQQDIAVVLEDVEAKLGVMEFLINPLGSDHQIPYGFHTVGFTKVLLPEIYVSGMAVNDIGFRQLYPFMKALFTYLTVNGCAMHPSGEVCKVINEQFELADLHHFFQARPVDVERLIYGQGLVLRYWLDAHGYREGAQAIQIVWRENNEQDFPVVSTFSQLLLDYVPFGTPCPTPIVGIQNATATQI